MTTNDLYHLQLDLELIRREQRPLTTDDYRKLNAVIDAEIERRSIRDVDVLDAITQLEQELARLKTNEGAAARRLCECMVCKYGTLLLDALCQYREQEDLEQ